MTTSAPLGKLVPGVLSTGITGPQGPYKGGGFTPASLYCFVGVPPRDADLRVRFRKNGGEVGSTYITITAGTKSGSLAYTTPVADGDYFDVDIKQVGVSPNEGSDLIWAVVP